MKSIFDQYKSSFKRLIFATLALLVTGAAQAQFTLSQAECSHGHCPANTYLPDSYTPGFGGSDWMAESCLAQPGYVWVAPGRFGAEVTY